MSCRVMSLITDHDQTTRASALDVIGTLGLASDYPPAVPLLYNAVAFEHPSTLAWYSAFRSFIDLCVLRKVEAINQALQNEGEKNLECSIEFPFWLKNSKLLNDVEVVLCSQLFNKQEVEILNPLESNSGAKFYPCDVVMGGLSKLFLNGSLSSHHVLSLVCMAFMSSYTDNNDVLQQTGSVFFTAFSSSQTLDSRTVALMLTDAYADTLVAVVMSAKDHPCHNSAVSLVQLTKLLAQWLMATSNRSMIFECFVRMALDVIVIFSEFSPVITKTLAKSIAKVNNALIV